MADWEEPANWGGMPPPNAPGAEVVVRTPKISKYLVMHRDATVGTLRFLGEEALPGGILAAEGSEPVLRFDNGAAPAVLDWRRMGRDTVGVAIEFARDLIVTNGYFSRGQGSSNSLYFDSTATFTPFCQDGEASLTFAVNSRITPNRERNLLDRRQQNVVRGYIEDSVGGAPLRLVKSGAGHLAIACSDNAYSGGTRVEGGTLFGINGENMDSPFLPFGIAPAIDLADGTTLALLSSKPGVWGPGNGYDIHFAGAARLSVRGADDWNGAPPPSGTGRLRQIGSLSMGGTNAVINLGGTKLRVMEPVRMDRSATLRVNAETAVDARIADADFTAGIRQGGTDPVRIVKTGSGTLRLGADGDFAGGIDVKEGGIEVGSNGALGTGPATFAEKTQLLIDTTAFRPAMKIDMRPGAHEIWKTPLARLGSTDEEKAGCRISVGVNLGIGADLGQLQNKTIVLTGGRLYAYRDRLGSETNGFVLGSGIALYTMTTNLDIGLGYPQGSEFGAWQRLQNPFRILGPIREHKVSATLRKRGSDRLEIGGVCETTGGTVIQGGTVLVLPSGRLGSGPVTLECNPKGNSEVWLKLTSPDNLTSGTEINLVGKSKLALDFDGEITVKALVIDGTPRAAGIWSATWGKDVHFEKNRLSGRGRLRVAPEE